MWNQPDKPFQALPPLPPASELLNLYSPQLINQYDKSISVLAGLNWATKLLPNPEVLVNTVPLLEAQASSEIENIVTTQDELFRADLLSSSHHSPAVKEALRYHQALHLGQDLLQTYPLSSRIAAQVASCINGYETDVRKNQGTYIGNPATRERIYTPPQGKEVITRHLQHWDDFIHEDTCGVRPLIKMALLHYQFEAIHPFSDANGRTGRIINQLYLLHAGLLDTPIIYLSGAIVRHKDEYYRRLRMVTQQDQWEEWVIFMLRMVEETANWTLEIIKAINYHIDTTYEQVRTILPQGTPALELTRLLYTQPYIRIKNIVDNNLAQRATASKWLNLLTEQGVLSKSVEGRTTIYVNNTFADLLFNTPVC